MSPLALVLAGLAIAAALWAWSVRGVAGSNAVAVCVVLGCCAVAFNVVVPIANVEATTTVVICSSLVLGMRVGATVGMLAVLGTGATMGLGPWTAWQVLGTAMVAGMAAAAGPIHRNLRREGWLDRIVLASITVTSVLVYDVVVTAATLRSTGALAEGSSSLIAALLLGLPFTVVHVVASTAFTVLAGPALVFALGRARVRIHVAERECAAC